VVADPVRLQILRVLSQVSDATVTELATHSSASYQTLRRHLDALETCGVIREQPGVSDGETSGRPAARFSLSPDVRESVRSATGASTSTTFPANPSLPARR
jgi:predicted ArsR family transcriptional regulator